ncbi:MAG: hypothetical protein OXT67_10490 [Zetaproteobacteria bacterium]|nr:hypothetical protein [Zetaproteobacteria bacterium]
MKKRNPQIILVSALYCTLQLISCKPPRKVNPSAHISTGNRNAPAGDVDLEVSYQLDLDELSGKKNVPVRGKAAEDMAPETLTPEQMKDLDPDGIRFVTTNPHFTSFFTASYGKNADFSCPGNMVMTGVSSRFDPFTETDSLVQRGDIAATGDRIFAFTCSSLTQNNGKRLQKSSCSWSPEKYRDAVIHYTCPVNTYMTGQRSFYDTEKKDRAYQFQCCQLKNHAEKEATVAYWPDPFYCEEGPVPTCSGPAYAQPILGLDGQPIAPQFNFENIHMPTEPYSFQCAQTGLVQTSPRSKRDLDKILQFVRFDQFSNTVMQGIKLERSAAQTDRVASYYCCHLTSGTPQKTETESERKQRLDQCPQTAGLFP